MKRNKAIHFRVNETEFKVLDEIVKKHNMRRGAYCRLATLKELPHLVPEINRLTYVELGRIGNNLNQIAKHLNSEKSFNFNECLDLLNSLRTKLIGLQQ